MMTVVAGGVEDMVSFVSLQVSSVSCFISADVSHAWRYLQWQLLPV